MNEERRGYIIDATSALPDTHSIQSIREVVRRRRVRREGVVLSSHTVFGIIKLTLSIFMTERDVGAEVYALRDVRLSHYP